MSSRSIVDRLDVLPANSVIRALQGAVEDIFQALPRGPLPLQPPPRAPAVTAPTATLSMASVAPSLRSHLSPSAIAQALEGYNTAGVLLRSKVQCEPVFNPDEIHLWLGWAGWTRTLVVLLNSYAQLLQSTSISVPLSFSLREVSSITAHLDFGLTCIHDTPGILFLSECLRPWRLAYEPLLERMHECSLLLDETIEMLGTNVDRELFQRARHYLCLLRVHSGAQPHHTLVFGKVEECLMYLAGLLFGDWPTKDVEGVVEPAPAYEGRHRVDVLCD
ncbi:hypothetical protein CERSUDRAFT_100092 [Gelatoporia subvermispora B]|uniref:Uncharacterized protein n=1 Tax=Ceriporiopsis subvermispora (strain B) TaxID=914234 RepID=M2QIE2_CERS8|nr:hypothetical protein CERSUDRAFT_100092 [Gelatoporia subvermispora B]